ncbi:MAG: acylphosphatase [Deltaproteobacteria bacterium CG11_big_fil_rev_8_21_14_0_20_42_23]|nr:MAG: acylphosphatase [Deltaproteobacteria bacterium CG11_big_fil_rev_8_21_14_0_20_42_23]PJC64992.1 MAG: acylphosphatase [Deltaproteobacteria bacterium CG_4_9_14_0_2_um_filter_42_21]
MIRYTMHISGKVQGVFYRASAQKIAHSLSLMGTVKNLPNGDVEVVAEGEKEALDEFFRWCKEGPTQAEVDSVSRKISSATQEFTAFTILR